ncbi:MAG TPA: DUF4136 domain-containing protein [Pyrinomonadaceae bacterium]|jgi:hypothetical protein
MKQMKKLIILLIIVSASSASAQKVKIRADTNVDLSKYKTYGWDTSIGAANLHILATTMNAVEQALTEKGFRKVEKSPDLTISILTTADSDLYTPTLVPQTMWDPVWLREWLGVLKDG